MDSCLHKNLKLRLSISALATHPFVTKYEGVQNNQLGRWINTKKKEMEMAMAQRAQEAELAADPQAPVRLPSAGPPKAKEAGKEAGKEGMIREGGTKDGKGPGESEAGVRRGSVLAVTGDAAGKKG